MTADFRLKTINLWCLTAGGALLWWGLGLNLFIYHFAAIALFLYVSSRLHYEGKGVLIPPSAILLAAIGLIYLFSITLRLSEGDSSRVVAALYNFSFWIMGAALVIAIANVFELSHAPRIFRSLMLLGWIIGIAAVAALIVWKSGVQAIVFKTPLYWITRFIGTTTLVESSLLVRPLLWDWFASLTRPRFNMFSPYPTAAGGIIMIILMIAIIQAASEKKMQSLRTWALVGLNLFALTLTLSRMSVFAFMASMMSVYVLQKKNFTVWMVMLLMLLIAAEPLLELLFNFFLGLREGSNSIRLELYKYSIMQLEGVDWILGKGLKPRETYFTYPIGSHSTYVSLLYKSGLGGAGLFVLFQASLLLRWFLLKSHAYRSRQAFFVWKGTGLVFIGMAMWMVTEDIDAPQMLAFLYFSFVGIFEGLRKELLNEHLSRQLPSTGRLQVSGADAS